MATAQTSSPAGLTISEAAATTGLSAHTLRYYERAGLMLGRVDRAPSSHRRYSEADLGWIELLTRLRKTGLPIRRVREYARLVGDGPGNEDKRLALLEAHRQAVLEQLGEIQSSLAAIDYKIHVYREKLKASA